jgi:hypothetical protein
VTAVVATIGAYGIWQEWWIGTLWLSIFVILAMSRCIPERDAVIACVRSPRRLRTRQKRSTRRWLLPALLVGGLAYFLPSRFDGVPIPSLLRALLRNGVGARRN